MLVLRPMVPFSHCAMVLHLLCCIVKNESRNIVRKNFVSIRIILPADIVTSSNVDHFKVKLGNIDLTLFLSRIMCCIFISV